MLSTTQAVPLQEFTFNGTTYRRAGTHFRVTYNLACDEEDILSQNLGISLADRGCNDGFLGSLVLKKTHFQTLLL